MAKVLHDSARIVIDLVNCEKFRNCREKSHSLSKVLAGPQKPIPKRVFVLALEGE